ncbi:MAG: histidinol-phosphate transaminase [Xylanivirga thermophila]|jgi:histidinol-phosphate aminotransferase|uniref:histidinol-phosphate transaminase n=1 Tax=Xylanivirga thermophila TaxID=2496273 RepID=UPI0039F56CE3
MNEYIKNCLKLFKNYKAENSRYKIKLDANENPFNMPYEVRKALANELLSGECKTNRYPDPNADKLRTAIANYCNVSKEQVIVGNGSDENIQMIVNAFVDREDKVLCPYPSFSMYEVYATIGGGITINIPLDENFEYDINTYKEAIDRYNPKVIFLCTPNNPTGNVISQDFITDILDYYQGLVIIDEAYYEFYGHTMLNDIIEYPNVIFIRTFSKAFGLAGLRIGYMVCNKNLAEQVLKVKPPYNINSFSQKAALYMLDNIEVINKHIQYIKDERQRLFEKLNQIENIKVFPSHTNFLLIKTENIEQIRQSLKNEGISVRKFYSEPLLDDYIRVTVGNAEENKLFLDVLSNNIERKDETL